MTPPALRYAAHVDPDERDAPRLGRDELLRRKQRAERVLLRIRAEFERRLRARNPKLLPPRPLHAPPLYGLN